MSGDGAVEVELVRPDDALVMLVQVLTMFGPHTPSAPFALVGGLAELSRWSRPFP